MSSEHPPAFCWGVLLLFPGLGPLPDVHAGLLAVVEEGGPALVAGVVSLQAAPLQGPPTHLSHSNRRLLQL